MSNAATYFSEHLSDLQTGYVQFSGDGRVTAMNQYLAELLGYPSPEPLIDSEILAEIFSGNTSTEPFRANLTHAGNVNPIDASFKRKDGREVKILLTILPSIEEKGLLSFEAIVTDVTHIRYKQEVNRHIATIKAAGTLARRVAHDISNKLTAVLGYAELAMLKIPQDDKIYSYIETVRKSAQNTLNDIHELKRLYAYPTNQPETANLLETIYAVSERFQDELPNNIHLEVATNRLTELKVSADYKSVKLALTEILKNAQEALPEGGSILLNVKNIPVDGELSAWNLTPGNYAVISITDSGVGIQDAIRSEIFEPFFTTRSSSAVNGFGLAIVEMIMYMNRGMISFDSKPGAGSVFHLYFPIVEESS